MAVKEIVSAVEAPGLPPAEKFWRPRWLSPWRARKQHWAKGPFLQAAFAARLQPWPSTGCCV